MKKIFINVFFICLLILQLCCCSKNKSVSYNAQEPEEKEEENLNKERDYFICPYWFEAIDFQYQLGLYNYRNFNNREKIKTLSVYSQNSNGKRLEDRYTYNKGLLTKWEAFPSTGDDYSYTFVYDDNGRLITKYSSDESGYVTDNCNYSYSFEDGKLVCNCTGSRFGDTVYTEEIVDNSFHISKTQEKTQDYYIEFNNSLLSKFTKKYTIIETEYKDEYYFNYEGKNIHVKTYCDNELNRQQEWIRNGDIANYYHYYGENRESGRVDRNDIFKDFDNYDNWLTMIEDDGTTYIREFEYTE